MTLPTSGPLSINDIAGEFGGTAPHSMNEYYAGGGLVPAGASGTYGAVPSSGQISIQNFYGTSAIYPVSYSTRFNSADSSYLVRFPATAGNRQTWTMSLWFKRTTISGSGAIISAGTSGVFLVSWSSDAIRFRGSTLEYITTRVFRDPSAWYHLVMVADTTNGTAADRFKVYINGVRETSFSTNTPAALNEQFEWNNNVLHNIYRYAYTGSSYNDGYLAEVNFIDGQALTPSSFGQTNSSTGVWEPIQYSGSYGTNGFFLPMNTSVSATSWNYNPMGTFTTYNRQGSFVQTATQVYLTGAGYDGGMMGGTASPAGFLALQSNWNLDALVNRDGVNSSPFPTYFIYIGRSPTASAYYSDSGDDICSIQIGNAYGFYMRVRNANGSQLYYTGTSGSPYAYAGNAVRISFNASTYTFTFYANTSSSFTGMTQVATYTLTGAQKTAMQTTFGNDKFYIGGGYRANNDGWRDVRWYTT